MELENKQQVSKIIFLICLTLSLISFVSLIFPVLLVELTIGEFNREINFFELGVWAIPIIIGNIVFLGLLIIHKLNRFPVGFNKIIHKISVNDVSRRTTVIVLLALFSIYLGFSIDELQREEFELGDYQSIPTVVKEFSFDDPNVISPQIRYFFLHISLLVFDNIRILPFIASISLLLITFFLTLELTKKRISALVAFTVLLQSNLFLLWDTTSAYENFWTSFYFFSLYLILKKPIGSHVSFILGMLSKPLVITFLPVNLFAILTNNKKKSQQIILWITYSAIILLIIVAFFTNNIVHVSEPNFDFKKLISSMNEFGNTLRFDGLILMLFIPCIIILFRKTGQIAKSVNLIFVGIIMSILSQPIMYSLIEMTLQPYRFIPLIVFSAISIGIIFSNSKIADQE